MPTKLEQAIELLRSDNGAELSHAEAARQIGCNEGTIRRARAVIAAQEKADQFSDDPSESGRLLANVVNAAEALDLIDTTIGDLKEEMKDLKDQRKELVGRVKDAIHAARETHPLFERSEAESNGKSDKGERGDKSDKGDRKPSLAATG